ncbi:MAG: hypothetical protein ACK4TA_08205 [Saprospiraceae bacterium]
MKKQDDIQKELQALSPLLAKLKAKEQKPEVPENYFQSLPNQVWEQIKLQPAPERPTAKTSAAQHLLNRLQTLLQPRIAVSLATFIILIIAGIYFINPFVNSSEIADNQELTAGEITKYINDNLAQFDTELLMQATSDVSDESILPAGEFSEEEVDVMMEEIIKDLDTKTLEEML